MDGQEFFDLALKAIAGHATETERAELDTLITRQPELKAALERLRGDTRLAREDLPLVNATRGAGPELPAYPMNALANDQEKRIKEYLEAAGVSGDVDVRKYDRGTSQSERERMRTIRPASSSPTT